MGRSLDRPWTCRNCHWYDFANEESIESYHCLMAYCPVAFAVCDESDGMVPANEQQCDQFIWVERADGRHPRRTGKPIAKGWPQGYTREEAIKTKRLLMNRNKTAIEWARILGMPASSIARIRQNHMWKSVPLEGEE